VDSNDHWTRLNLNAIPTGNPVLLASVQTFNGPNTVGVRLKRTSDGSFALFLEEEKSKDSETAHTLEEVALFATSEGPIADVAGNTIGEAGIASVHQPSREDWHSISTTRNYNGSNPCHVRLRNVESNSFQFRIEEWQYLDGYHWEEEVGYVVLEAGIHEIDNNTFIEVGTVDTDHNFSSVRFSSSFQDGPVLITQAQTFNGRHEIVTRSRNVTADGAEIRVQEEEGLNGTHINETVGYISAPFLRLGEVNNFGEFKPSDHGFEFTNSFNQLPDLPDLPANLDRRIGNININYGLCGGMALAARDFFLNRRPIPNTGSTTPQSGDLFNYLWQRQLDTFDSGFGWGYLVKFLRFYLPTTFTSARSVPEFRSVIDALDAGQQTILGLVYVRAGNGNLWDNHQVLAYDYNTSGGETRIKVYDPNFPNNDNVEVRVELNKQGFFNPAPGNKKIDAAQYDGSRFISNVIGLIHMDVDSQPPPENL
jgi:hypothetical protein